MSFQLLPLEEADLPLIKHDMQEVFQLGATQWEDIEEEILPESHIDRSLNAIGSIAYKAVVDCEILGCAIVVIDGNHGHLDFLYVKSGTQSKGIGQQIWNAIEARHPEVTIWETCTPYFDTRNLHFYINRCGFAAVEFYNPKHKDPNAPEGDDGSDFFFRFEKKVGYSIDMTSEQAQKELVDAFILYILSAKKVWNVKHANIVDSHEKIADINNMLEKLSNPELLTSINQILDKNPTLLEEWQSMALVGVFGREVVMNSKYIPIAKDELYKALNVDNDNM